MMQESFGSRLRSQLARPDAAAAIDGPGLYLIAAAHDVRLGRFQLAPDQTLYVGMTEDGLDIRDHFVARHSGFSTLRRSLGALLKDELELTARPRAPGSSRGNRISYRFDSEGEARLSDWMRRNLLVARISVTTEVRPRERALIGELEPLLNLTGWRNPDRRAIKAMRAVCAAEAGA